MKIDISLADLNNMVRQELRNKINRKEQEEWRASLRDKEDLKFYRLYKTKLGEERLWTNSKRDKIIKMYQSGTVLLKGKTGKSEEEKDCQECRVKEDLKHHLEECKIYDIIRRQFGMANIKCNNILDLRKKNEKREKFLELYNVSLP